MNNRIAVLSPVYNAASLISPTAASVHQLPWIVVDNASEDNTVILSKKSHPASTIFINKYPLSRTENWSGAICYFLQNTSYTWMKWLFAGDKLYLNSNEIMDRAIARFPEAKLIVWQVEELDHSSRRLWKPPLENKPQLFSPQKSLQLAAKYGNWFGPPLAHAIHREALESLGHFGCYPWAADMEICLQIAKCFPVAYINEPIGEFILPHRAFFQKNKGKPAPILEEALLKLKALEWLEELEEQPHILSDLRSSIQFQVVKHLIRRKDLRLFKHLKDKIKTLLGCNQ